MLLNALFGIISSRVGLERGDRNVGDPVDEELDIELSSVSSNKELNKDNEKDKERKENSIQLSNPKNLSNIHIDHNIDPQQEQQMKVESQIINNKQKYLLSKMKEIMEPRAVIDNYAADDFVYDENTGIIPTRQRFVSRSDILLGSS